MSASPKYHVELIDGPSRVQFTSSSSILRPDGYHPAGAPHLVSSATAEIYGNPKGTKTIRIGNGGLGPTGALRQLCLAYLGQRPDLKFDWVINHSRHTQVALQAGVVDVALTYEREEEQAAETEGWSRTVGTLCHDHFVIGGPREDPAGLIGLHGSARGANDVDASKAKPLSALAFDKIAKSHSTFHSRGDGSATMHRELAIWTSGGVTPKEEAWYKVIANTPLAALQRAAADGAYLLIDRSTFLYAHHIGAVRDVEVFVEGGSELMNTTCILVRADERRGEVLDFVEWLQGPAAQAIIERFGKNWDLGVPLVTPVSQLEVAPHGKPLWPPLKDGG
jgi:ABC-type tungstate transport system permease subunit